MKHGCYLDLTEKLKKVAAVPILVAGRMDLPELAEKAIEENKADLVALGRALLSDPYWPNKVREGMIEDIRPCIGCHDSCFSGLLRPLSCSVNPSTGRERLLELKPSAGLRNVLIAGGGIAGMEAARVAALRGHKVSLYEKKGSLGGHLTEGSIPEFKKDIERLLEWYRVQLRKIGVNIFLNMEVTPELVKTEASDILIVATGSMPLIPRIAGIEKPIVSTCIDLLLGRKTAGNTVVVVGGGLVGCETALWLAEQGKKTVIVEILPELMKAGTPMPHANRLMLLDLIALNNIDVLTSTAVDEIKDEGVVLINRELRKKELKCDTVALATGLRSENQLYHLLKERVAHIYMIGDCKEPRRILEAIWDGYVIANSI
jgi:2-enoate reductase